MHLSPADQFTHPTIAALAPRTSGLSATAAEQGAVTGDVPLTPIQRWLLAENTARPERFTQSIRVTLTEQANDDALRAALNVLLTHHDALRMRFSRTENRWHQYNAGVTPVLDPSLPLDLDGPLIRVDRIDARTIRLTAHQLVVDAVSWRILLADLESTYHGRSLPAKTTSFRDYATRLAAYAAQGGFDDEWDYWAGVNGTIDIPHDRTGTNTVGSVRSVTMRLTKCATRALVSDVPRVYQTGIKETLAAALGQVLCRWAGTERILIDQKGHGREHLFADVDLSQTVGWYTTIFPVALGDASDWPTALAAAAETQRAIPRHGIGYGALKYLGTGLPNVIEPRVSFNYLGHFDAGQLTSDADPDSMRAHALDVIGRVQDDRLELTWLYSTELHREDTIAALAAGLLTALIEIIGHCAKPAPV